MSAHSDVFARILAASHSPEYHADRNSEALGPQQRLWRQQKFTRSCLSLTDGSALACGDRAKFDTEADAQGGRGNKLESCVGACSKKILVEGLPFNFTEDQIVSVFNRYGTVDSVEKLPAMSTISSTAFVCMKQPEEAKKLVASLNERVPIGLQSPVLLRFADVAPREPQIDAGAPISESALKRSGPTDHSDARGRAGEGRHPGMVGFGRDVGPTVGDREMGPLTGRGGSMRARPSNSHASRNRSRSPLRRSMISSRRSSNRRSVRSRRSRTRSRSPPQTRAKSVRRGRSRPRSRSPPRARAKSVRSRRSRTRSRSAPRARAKEDILLAIERALLEVECNAESAAQKVKRLNDEFAGFLCPGGLSRRFKAHGEKRFADIKAMFHHALESVNQALGLPAPVLQCPGMLDDKAMLSQAQQWRSQVLARYVARLGDRGAALERIVQVAAANDSRWRIDAAPFHESALAQARGIYGDGVSPRTDRNVCDWFGLGSSLGAEIPCDSAPWEAWEGGAAGSRNRADIPVPAGLGRTILKLSDICWAHSSISESFREEGTVLQTTIELLSGAIIPDSLPPFEVMRCKSLTGEKHGNLGGPRWWALSGNRRLAALRLASFFEPCLQYVCVRIVDASAHPHRLNTLLTGAGHGRPKLTSKGGGQYVTIRETGEVIGQRLSADTYGADLLWMLFQPDELPPPVMPGRASFLDWRQRLTTILSAAGGKLRWSDLKNALRKDYKSKANTIMAVIPTAWTSKSNDWIALPNAAGRA